MNILRGISVIALCASVFYEAQGQGNCALSWDDGTELESTFWSFGYYLDSIEDVTAAGTVVVDMVATSITSISSIVVDSTSGSTFMEPTLVDGRFIVTLTDEFENYEELETSTTILVTVTFICSTNTRSLEIYQPITDTNNHYPEFQNAPYVYELPMPFPSGTSLQWFGQISARDIDLTNTLIDFTLNSSDSNSDGFSISWSSKDTTDTKLHYADLVTTALLQFENNVTFTIYATDNGSPTLTSETTVTISVDEESSVVNSPVFTYPLYIADLSEITIEEASGTSVTFNQGDVSLSQGIDDTVVYTIVDNIGSYEDNFLITVSEDYTYISLTLQNVTESLLAEQYIVLTLTATRTGASATGSTVLHIDLPGISCTCNSTTDDSCTTVETITETEDDDTVTTTDISTTPSLNFPSNLYRFDKDSTFTGVLMTQTAVATDADGTIVYSASFDDEDLATRILIDATTAELEVTAVVSPGVHTFKIIASIDELNLSATAVVILVISSLTDCSGDIVFGYALQIIELEEQSVHEDILPLDDNGCTYSIYSQTPSQDLFSLSDNLLNTVAIDREASYFSNMTVAQVRIVIDASCPNDTDTDTTDTISKRDTEYEVLTENIAYIRTRTILVVIIGDINDNAPVWSSDTPSYLGFPGYELSQLIHVPYVYRFSATDADIGENAIVAYTLPSGSDDTFYIHESEGSLYIQQGVYVQDGLEFTIIATDGTFQTPTNVVVKMLESTNVAVLFVSGGVLEDVDDIVEELSESTGYLVRAIGEAVISESDASSSDTSRSSRSISIRKKRSTYANTLLRLLIYGLSNNEPVDSEILISTLESTDSTWKISTLVTLESILSDTTITESNVTAVNTHGYWAAIIVLSVLLVLTIIAAGIFYYVCCRSQKPTSTESDITYENFDNTHSNGNTGNHFVKSLTLSESPDHTLESTDSPNDEWILSQTGKSFFEKVRRTFSTLKGGKDDDLVFITGSESAADAPSNLSKRKSVAFSSTVEEIEVSRL